MTKPNTVSEEVISKAIQGDTAAFTEIYEAYYKRVYFMGIQYFKNEDIAKDVVQEVFIKVYKQIKSLKAPKAFSSWLHVITYRECQNLSRKKLKILELGDEEKIEDFPDKKEIEITEMVENERIKDIIAESLSALSDPLKTVAILRFFEELKVQEIADILDIPKATVGTRLIKIRKVLQKDLKKQGVSLEKNYSLTILSSITLHDAYTSLLEKQTINEGSIKKVLDTILNNGVTVGWTLLTKLGLVMTIGSVAVLGYSGYKVVESAPNTVLIESIDYQEYRTNESIPVEVLLNTSPNGQEIGVYLENTPIYFDVDNNKLLFTINNNGKYTVKVAENEESFSITQIDKEAPIVSDIQYDGNNLTFSIRDNFNEIDYQESYIEYEGNKFIIDETHQIQETFLNNLHIIVHDVTGNRSVYEVQIKEVMNEVMT